MFLMRLHPKHLGQAAGSGIHRGDREHSRRGEPLEVYTRGPGLRSVCLHVCARGVPAGPSSSHSPDSGPALPTPRQTAHALHLPPHPLRPPCRAGLGTPLVSRRSPGRGKSPSSGLCLCGGSWAGSPELPVKLACSLPPSICDLEASEQVGSSPPGRPGLLLPCVPWGCVLAHSCGAIGQTHPLAEGGLGWGALAGGGGLGRGSEAASLRPQGRGGEPPLTGCGLRRACRANFMADNTFCSQDFTDK